MQMNNENIDTNIINNDSLNIREEIEKYLIHWKWFLFFLLLSLTVAYTFLRYATPQYSASTSILIKDNNKSGISAELAAFEDLGIVGGGSSNNTDNEIEILKSRKIIGSVIDTLDLFTTYFVEGRVKKTEVYNDNPIKINFISRNKMEQMKDTSFVVSILSNGKFELKDINGASSSSSSYDFNTVIKSRVGLFNIIKSDDFKENNINIFVYIRNKPSVISSYLSKIKIASINKNSSVLNLSLNHSVKEKAEDFLNELVRQYNFDAINDKSEISKKTKEFIDDRLVKIGLDLAKIQDDVKNYKNKNNITGLSSEGELALAQASINNEKIVDLETQLNLINWVGESLNKQSGKFETLPQNLGFSDVAISHSIDKYNELVHQKNRLSLSAGNKNPLLLQYTREIVSLKENLKKSISNLGHSLKSQLIQLKKEAYKVTSKVSSIPMLERGFIDIARQQEIISGLYSYLLKKKEETAISLAITVPNAKIIDVAYSTGASVFPKKKMVYLAALLLGLIIPFIIIYIKNLLDTKIHSRKDIEDLTTVPFIGDVPHSETNEKIVIGNDARTSTAEAFRLIRTNLDFMLPNKDTDLGKTIFITSTTSGEGKSFISINLAAALSLSSKKVLLLGMDLRAPKVTEYLGIPERKGITNFITNDNISLDDVKFSIPEIKGLDIIASGVIPPNPAELLLSSKIKDLFDEVKKDYDYIIVDTAPVNLVTDTLLVAKYADMFMYVTRANYLDKRMLNVPQTLYNEKKLPNMAIVLNDTDIARGYGYGYGYGYGNGYIDDVKKPWYKRILS